MRKRINCAEIEKLGFYVMSETFNDWYGNPQKQIAMYDSEGHYEMGREDISFKRLADGSCVENTDDIIESLLADAKMYRS